MTLSILHWTGVYTFRKNGKKLSWRARENDGPQLFGKMSFQIERHVWSIYFVTMYNCSHHACNINPETYRWCPQNIAAIERAEIDREISREKRDRWLRQTPTPDTTDKIAREKPTPVVIFFAYLMMAAFLAVAAYALHGSALFIWKLYMSFVDCGLPAVVSIAAAILVYLFVAPYFLAYNLLRFVYAFF